MSAWKESMSAGERRNSARRSPEACSERSLVRAAAHAHWALRQKTRCGPASHGEGFGGMLHHHRSIITPVPPRGPPRTASASVATEDGGEASVSDPPLAMFTSVCRDNCANQRDAPAHAPTVTVLTSLIALCHGTAFRTRSTFELSIIYFQ